MGAERRAGLASNLRTLSTPNIALNRKRFEDCDLAGRRGSGWTPQLGPRYGPSQHRRPATAAGDFFGGVAASRRSSGAELLRRSSASRPSAQEGDSTFIKPPDVTAQEAVLLRQLKRIEELRSGNDKMAGTQWTPRGQHILSRRKVDPEQQEEEELDLSALLREMHERTKRLEDVVDDKIARREAWLDLWDSELHDLGWKRPEKTGRRALHGSMAGAYVDAPAMPGVEDDQPISTPMVEVQERPTAGTSAGSPARRHPQHKTVGRRANAGLSVPYRSGRYQAVVQHRHAYTQALRGVTEVENIKRRERMRLKQGNAAPHAVFLLDAKVGQ